MKAIIRPSHNMGKTHVYIMEGEGYQTYSLYYALCRGVVRRKFLTLAESGNTHPIECERCKRKVEKEGITF